MLDALGFLRSFGVIEPVQRADQSQVAGYASYSLEFDAFADYPALWLWFLHRASPPFVQSTLAGVMGWPKSSPKRTALRHKNLLFAVGWYWPSMAPTCSIFEHKNLSKNGTTQKLPAPNSAAQAA